MRCKGSSSNEGGKNDNNDFAKSGDVGGNNFKESFKKNPWISQHNNINPNACGQATIETSNAIIISYPYILFLWCFKAGGQH